MWGQEAGSSLWVEKSGAWVPWGVAGGTDSGRACAVGPATPALGSAEVQGGQVVTSKCGIWRPGPVPAQETLSPVQNIKIKALM